MKKYIITILLLCVFNHTAWSTGPKTHLYFSKLWLEQHQKTLHLSEDEFYIGSIFADIHHFTNIHRILTHKKGVTTKDIFKEKSSFHQSLLLHSFIDEQRKKLIKQLKIKDKLTEVPTKHHTIFLKLLEDEISDSKMDFVTMLYTIADFNYEKHSPKEISINDINRWKIKLLSYISFKPSTFVRISYITNTSFRYVPAQDTKDWPRLMKKYANDKDILAYYNKLTDLVTKNSQNKNIKKKQKIHRL